MKRANRQRGFSLIEVLVALLIMAIGLLGAAAIQLNALKYTDSSSLRSQVSFIAYDMMDRIRANPDGSYALTSLDNAPAANLNAARDQDLADFKSSLINFVGSTTTASIGVFNRVVTITINWDDSRADKSVNATNTASSSTGIQTFTLTSRVADDAVATP
ncbi:type IV pilus modification protein PilV [Pseudomonas abieticivorans]|uniref:type IV pilus modification protein PilV n=1 Tax=Pseudomonas abieticivorans TaxID=2931382 RepID=UPI0020BEDE4F|nr:type IV pilus modification protein PilV [Pseudomonas sp. PIA16]